MANQKFIIKVRITTECDEFVDERDVTTWTEEIFRGCDLGNVRILEVKEEEEEEDGAT